MSLGTHPDDPALNPESYCIAAKSIERLLNCRFLTIAFFAANAARGSNSARAGTGSNHMQFHCPHCGALYEKSDPRAAVRDDETAQCVVCRNMMHKAESGQMPTFKLLKRPESDTE
jgi:hypothetical protein